MAPLCTNSQTHTHFFSPTCVWMSDVCPLRPSGYYTPTDGALPFIACTFWDFSHCPPPEKNTVFSCCCGCESSVACSCLSSDEEQTQRKRRGWKDSRSPPILGSDGEWHQHLMVYCNHESHRNTLMRLMGGRMWNNTPKIELWWWWWWWWWHKCHGRKVSFINIMLSSQLLLVFPLCCVRYAQWLQCGNIVAVKRCVWGGGVDRKCQACLASQL